MSYNPNNPLIIQSDRTILLEVNHPNYEEVRDRLARFAELVKSPEHVHTYRISPLSLWNAAASGIKPFQALETLEQFSKYPVPQNIKVEIQDQMDRYGRIKIEQRDGNYILHSHEPALIAEVWHYKAIRPLLMERLDAHTILMDPRVRGHLKQALIKIGWPVEDLAGYTPGAFHEIELLPITRNKYPFRLRLYQQEAVEIFHAGGGTKGGSGVIVLPCGAGKTIVGMAAVALLKTQTLILATSTVAVRQWQRELLDKTSCHPDDIGEYTGETKSIKPITLATYQILTYRKRKFDEFVHFALFNEGDWGLIIYDEVHLLPAPVFRITAEIQAKRRLGLTATLVREDGHEDDVFSLIGPKKYDVPWKVLEGQGWIATAICIEIRIPMASELRMNYAVANPHEKFRLASENEEKLLLVNLLLKKHHADQVLIIGQYLEQLSLIAQRLNASIITGKTPVRDREKMYDAFRNGDLKLLVLSKVGNYSVDLPDANVLIQVSGTFGSRQEEAQRLGRILRPKRDGSPAHFYTLVTQDTCEQDFAQNRQLFLTEQGYTYQILKSIQI